MAAGIYNFTIEQGVKFTRKIVWADQTGTPVQFSGYSAKMQIRDGKTKALLMELSTLNGRIMLGLTNGEIMLVLSALDTADITWRTGVYDLELTSANGDVTRLLQGSVSVSRGVTV